MQSLCFMSIQGLWFHFKMHLGGSGHRHNDGPDVKLYSVGWCLMLVVGCPPPYLNYLGQAWWLIVSIPDLWPLSYFESFVRSDYL